MNTRPPKNVVRNKGVDDRGIDRPERPDECPVVGPAQVGHDGAGVETHDAGYDPDGKRGQDQCGGSQKLQLYLQPHRIGRMLITVAVQAL